MFHDLATGRMACMALARPLCYRTTRSTATLAHVAKGRYHCQVHLPLYDALARPSQPLTWPFLKLVGTDCTHHTLNH